jgi:hypothetical protein
MRPNPIALLIAFAIFRWLTFRKPVSDECLIRPISDMYSDIMEKFYTRTNKFSIEPMRKGFEKKRVTLYWCNGLMDNASNASVDGLCLRFHFFISAGLRS